MHITPQIISRFCRTFDDQETQDLLEAMKVDLKSALRKNTFPRKYGDEIVEPLILNVQDQAFWEQLDLLINQFNFDL